MDYRSLPVPDSAPRLALKRGYRQHPIDTAHPLYNEPMIEVHDLGLKGSNYYHTPPNPPYHQRVNGSIPQLWLRKSVAEKLLRVNEALRPLGTELWLFDAWRPLAVQNYFHDIWMPAFLREENPSLDGDALWNEVEKYWSRGSEGEVDPTSPPPHYTGAAVDLTLRAIGGDLLYMGSIFDDATIRASTDYFEHHVIARSFSDLEARANRRLLHHAMAAEGFNNLPSEWWHYSWGDQTWARMTGTHAAYYGPARIPS